MDQRTKDIVHGNSEFLPGFAAWLCQNWHVWLAFAREANKVWDRGRKHYSARTIIEVLRHESALSDAGVEYKLNDHNTPDLARLYRLTFPERAGLFETRVQPNTTRGRHLKVGGITP